MFPQCLTLTLSFRLTPGSHIWSPHSHRTPFINLGITLTCCLPMYVCGSRRVHERREKQTKVALQTDSGEKKKQGRWILKHLSQMGSHCETALLILQDCLSFYGYKIISL